MCFGDIYTYHIDPVSLIPQRGWRTSISLLTMFSVNLISLTTLENGGRKQVQSKYERDVKYSKKQRKDSTTVTILPRDTLISYNSPQKLCSWQAARFPVTGFSVHPAQLLHHQEQATRMMPAGKVHHR